MTTEEIQQRVQPRRCIIGISAVLLPFDADGEIDFDSFARNVERTHRAGLTPAVNMDTGYTNLISAEQRSRVLRETHQALGGSEFVAGAFIETEAGQNDAPLAFYQQAVAEIVEHGGTPIIFQSSALKALGDREKVDCYRRIGESCESFLAFELGEMFAHFGQIYDLDTVGELMQIPQLAGMKHSSLDRVLEWQRLELRDRLRPDFKIYTGNDLAIDMVCYGSDYLLGLSAFCPEAFALRDALWQQGDARFYGLNDLIQYLGFFAFRPPVPAYKHTCAQFLKLRGRIESDVPHPRAARRPDSDVEILRDISQRLDEMMDGLSDPLPELASAEAIAVSESKMIIADLNEIAGRTYPARRWTRNLVGGASPIQAENFSMGLVVLEPDGGQVPWHNQEQEEIYFIVEGEGEMCLGEEKKTVTSGQVISIPPQVFHQLTNTGSTPMTMIYCYGPSGDVAHWKQELEGTLPRAGIEAPPLPQGAQPQCTEKPE